jgi:hypothetical protein
MFLAIINDTYSVVKDEMQQTRYSISVVEPDLHGSASFGRIRTRNFLAVDLDPRLQNCHLIDLFTKMIV